MKQKQRDFENFLINNLIYCRETHSFTHRLFNEFKEKQPQDYREAQHLAIEVMADLSQEFAEEAKK